MEAKLLTAERFVDLRTGFLYRYVISDTEYFRLHYHDYAEIFLVLEGNARHLVNGNVIHLAPRDLVLIRPEDTHDYISEDGKSFSMLNITFTLDTLQSIFDFLGEGFPSQALMGAKLPPTVRLTTSELAALQSKMKTISSIPQEETAKLKTALRTLLFEVLTRYFSDYTAVENENPAWLEAICTEVRKNGGFVEGSEKLFALTDKSREHVCRSMKKYMGQTVTEFINDLRLNYIANMLINSNHSVTEIVFDSGFNNLSWAAEQFRKKYGVTMGRFRKEAAQRAEWM